MHDIAFTISGAIGRPYEKKLAQSGLDTVDEDAAYNTKNAEGAKVDPSKSTKPATYTRASPSKPATSTRVGPSKPATTTKVVP